MSLTFGFLAIALLFVFSNGSEILDIVKLKDLELKEESNKLIKDPKLGPVCPSGCSGHGICNNGVCICQAGWLGDDCSYQVTQIQSGIPLYNQHVTVRSFVFYTIDTTSGSSLLINVTQLSTGGDADLYLLQNAIPTRSNYAYREISSDQTFSFTVPDAGTNTWYIGIYGYLDTYYNIEAFVGGDCPDVNQCNYPNGACISYDVCQCNSGWAGSDCSISVTNIALNRAYSGSVSYHQWNYYLLTVGQATDLLVTLNQTSTGDADLYLKFGAAPTLYDYDYRDASLSSFVSLTVNLPETGSWYIGVYGYAAATYLLKAVTFIQCPNQCSLHGSCRGTTCTCNSGFSGTYCQTMNNNLVQGVQVAGFAGDNSWNYYHATPATTSNMVIQVNSTSGDCDLYVKAGANPTIYDYDYRDAGIVKVFSLSVPNPGTQTWYIGIYGYSACQYGIQYTISNGCPGTPVCSGNGQCNNGLCVCNQGYGGDDCSISNIQSLDNGYSRTGYITTNIRQWQYYSFSVVSSSYITFDVKESSTVGQIYLYVARGRTPDTANYDYADLTTQSMYHRVHIPLYQAFNATWYIGVYANPFSGGNSEIDFSISAWASPF